MTTKKLLLLSLILVATFSYNLPSYIPTYRDSWVPEGHQGSFIDPVDGVVPPQENYPYYYIDNTHPNCTNSKNEFGTPEKPRKTIPEILYQAGSVVEIHGTNYQQGQLVIRVNGTAERPVWIRGPSIDNRPVIQSQLIVKGSYVIVENLHFNKDKLTVNFRAHSDSQLTHAVLRHTLIEGSGNLGWGAGVGIYGVSGKPIHDIIVYNCEIRYLGDDFDHVSMLDPSRKENDYHGIHPSYNCYNIWVLQNHIHHMGGDSIQIGTVSVSDESQAYNVFVYDNDFHSNFENAVDIKKAKNIIVSENYFHGDRSYGPVVLHNGSKRIYVLFNKVKGGMFSSDGVRDSWFIGNYVYESHPSIIDTSKPDYHPRRIYGGGQAIFMTASSGGAIGNTIRNYTKGIQFQGDGPYEAFNNLLSHKVEPEAYDFAAAKSMEAHNNLVYTEGLNIETHKVDCVNCLNQDPQFVQNAMPRLQKQSPAVDAGVNDKTYEKVLREFRQTFGLKLEGAFDSDFRFVGKETDIGAYENQCEIANSNCTYPKFWNSDTCNCVCQIHYDENGDIVCPINHVYSHEECKCLDLNHGQTCQEDIDCDVGAAKDCVDNQCTDKCFNEFDCQKDTHKVCRNTVNTPSYTSCQSTECDQDVHCSQYTNYSCQNNSCQCDLTTQCDNPYAIFDGNSCGCVCNYSEQDFPCINQNYDWVADKCECQCNPVLDRYKQFVKCPNGEIWNELACECYRLAPPSNCTRFLQAFSSGYKGPNFAKFYDNGVEQTFAVGRMYNFAVYDKDTFELKEFKHFFIKQHKVVGYMVDYVRNIQQGDWVAFGIQDDPMARCNSDCQRILEELGAPYYKDKLGYGVSIALIGQKGMASGQAIFDIKAQKAGVAYAERCISE